MSMSCGVLLLLSLILTRIRDRIADGADSIRTFTQTGTLHNQKSDHPLNEPETEDQPQDDKVGALLRQSLQ